MQLKVPEIVGSEKFHNCLQPITVYVFYKTPSKDGIRTPIRVDWVLIESIIANTPL